MQRVTSSLFGFFLLMSISLISAQASAATVTVIVDDYEPIAGEEPWLYSRIGTDRGEMGAGNFEVVLGEGTASINVQSGWAGVWTSAKHTANERDGADDTVDARKLLGRYVLDQWQARIVGIEVDLLSGSGQLKIEFKGADDGFLYVANASMVGAGTLSFDVPDDFSGNIKQFNWLIDGPGSAEVDEIRLRVEGPETSNWETAFLYSYAHLSSAHDPQSGFVRDRSRWPAGDFSAVPVTGTFALATAVAWDLGIVSRDNAVAVADLAQSAVIALPSCHGVLPHFVRNSGAWDIVDDTEWSTVDTAIALVSLILARQSLGLETNELEDMLVRIDWARLTDNGDSAISHGFPYECGDEPLPYRWDTFGAESFIVGLAYSAATGLAPVIPMGTSPTYDGSGFNDELAALMLPMTERDFLGNDWQAYRDTAFMKQFEYFNQPEPLYSPYTERGLFGVSASEVPEPWNVDPEDVYGAWGVGGRIDEDDGRSLIGYPILAPHYAAMVSAEHLQEAGVVVEFLLDTEMLSAMNNTESFGVDDQGIVRWNSLQGSWNLGMQVLGLGRSLSDQYLPHEALVGNDFLFDAFDALMCATVASEWIYKAYIGYYGRCPDQAGHWYWCQRLEDESGGKDLSPIIAAFGTSQEYTDRFDGLSDEQLITNLYSNMFDRDPEPAGLNFYLGVLEQWRQLWRDTHGGSDEGATEYALSRIALDVLNGAQGGDLETLTAQIDECPEV